MDNENCGKSFVRGLDLRSEQACQCLGEASDITGNEPHRRWNTIAEVLAVGGAQ